jgi:hypothetical protein
MTQLTGPQIRKLRAGPLAAYLSLNALTDLTLYKPGHQIFSISARHSQLKEKSLPDAFPLRKADVCRGRKCKGSWKSETSSSPVLPAQMYSF